MHKGELIWRTLKSSRKVTEVSAKSNVSKVLIMFVFLGFSQFRRHVCVLSRLLD